MSNIKEGVYEDICGRKRLFCIFPNKNNFLRSNFHIKNQTFFFQDDQRQRKLRRRNISPTKQNI